MRRFSLSRPRESRSLDGTRLRGEDPRPRPSQSVNRAEFSLSRVESRPLDGTRSRGEDPRPRPLEREVAPSGYPSWSVTRRVLSLPAARSPGSMGPAREGRIPGYPSWIVKSRRVFSFPGGVPPGQAGFRLLNEMNGARTWRSLPATAAQRPVHVLFGDVGIAHDVGQRVGPNADLQ